jgi:hypothetical protein
MRLLKLCIIVFSMLYSNGVLSQPISGDKFIMAKTYNAMKARQGVAVDKDNFYTINNTSIP